MTSELVRLPKHLLVTPAGNGHASSFLMVGSKKRLHELMALKFIDSTGGWLSDALLGLEYALAMGAKVSSLASARASALAPPWVVRMRPGAKAGCQTTYLLLLHLITLRCVL